MGKYVLALYDNLNVAEEVVKELEDNQFSRQDISLVAGDPISQPGDSALEAGSDTAGKAGAGAVIGGLAGLLAGVIAISVPGLGPLLAIGPLAAALAGAGIGAAAGGLSGVLTAAGVPEEHAQVYAEGVRRGAILVSVLTPDDRTDVARDIMNLHHPIDLEQRSGEFRQSNWTDQGQTAEPFPSEALDRERFHYAQRLGSTQEESTFIERQAAGENTSSAPDAGHLSVEEPINPDQAPVTASQTSGFEAYEPIFRDHFALTFAKPGETYDTYQPAYYFGYQIALDPRYHGMPWDIFEPNAQREWEKVYPENPWNQYKDAINKGWVEAVKRKD